MCEAVEAAIVPEDPTLELQRADRRLEVEEGAPEENVSEDRAHSDVNEVGGADILSPRMSLPSCPSGTYLIRLSFSPKIGCRTFRSQ